jgi:hypothetical protein
LSPHLKISTPPGPGTPSTSKVPPSQPPPPSLHQHAGSGCPNTRGLFSLHAQGGGLGAGGPHTLTGPGCRELTCPTLCPWTGSVHSSYSHHCPPSPSPLPSGAELLRKEPWTAQVAPCCLLCSLTNNSIPLWSLVPLLIGGAFPVVIGWAHPNCVKPTAHSSASSSPSSS